MKSFRALTLLALVATLVASCGGPKQTTIEGYSSSNLNRKRIFVLLPTATDVTFANAEQFGASRGVAAASAGETFDSELRTVLVSALQNRLDSNSIFNYAEMPVSGIVPLAASRDFTANGPATWESVKRAGTEAAIDYLLVLREVRVGNTAGSDPRGDESVTAAYQLLDVRKQSVMTAGTITASVSAPRQPSATYEQMAAELSAKLPFTVIE